MCFINKKYLELKPLIFYLQMYILLNPFLLYIIIILLYMLSFIYFVDIVFCDDGGERTYYRGTGVWGGELDGKPLNFEPYRPGLYVTKEGCRYELDGKAVDYHSNSYETGRNIRYDVLYKPEANNWTEIACDNSTQLGFVEESTDEERTRAAFHRDALRKEYDPNKHYSNKQCIFDTVKSLAKTGFKRIKVKLDKWEEKSIKKAVLRNEEYREMDLAHDQYRRNKHIAQMKKLDAIARDYHNRKRSRSHRWE